MSNNGGTYVTVISTSDGVVAGRMPALTGDATTSAGAVAVSVVKVNGSAEPPSTPVLGSNSSSQLVAALRVTLSSSHLARRAGQPLSTGVLGYATVPSACTITGWTIEVDAGTAPVKTLKVASGTLDSYLGIQFDLEQWGVDFDGYGRSEYTADGFCDDHSDREGSCCGRYDNHLWSWSY
jgi:hypothetical protein